MAAALDKEIGLTSKQETFCQELIKNGGNQTEAHKVAYPASLKWKIESVYETASLLAKSPKVASRMKQLNGRIEEKFKNEVVYDRKIAFKNFDRMVLDLEEQISNALQLPQTKDIIYNVNMLTRTKTTVEEQKAKLYSLFVQKTADVTKEYDEELDYL